MFGRVAKTIAALGMGHFVQLLTQLLLPPVFIGRYGIDAFGVWLVLSAVIGHLAALDFGLQSYVLNEMTVLYHRKEKERLRQIQAVGLWLTLASVGLGLCLATLTWLLPVEAWLKISGAFDAKLVLFFLALQVVASLLLGQVNGVHRVFGQAHRSVMIQNTQRLGSLVLTLGLAAVGAPFWWIALAQGLTVIVAIGAALASVAKAEPDVRPSFDYWDAKLAGTVLRQSSLFGLFALNQLLVFQVPLLVLHWVLGPVAVVSFSIARTLFSFIRQGVGLILAGLAPELTRLSGLEDKGRLAKLYRLSESTVASLVLVGNAGMFMLAPLLLVGWLNKTHIFEPVLFLLMMLVSAVLTVKETKLYFQYATNQHGRTAMLTSATYVGMVLLAVPAVIWLGVPGLLVLWLSVELLQTLCIHRFNIDLLAGVARLSLWPSVKLAVALGVMAVFFAWGGSGSGPIDVWTRTAFAILSVSFLSCISFFLFDLSAVMESLRSRARIPLGGEAMAVSGKTLS